MLYNNEKYIIIIPYLDIGNNETYVFHAEYYEYIYTYVHIFILDIFSILRYMKIKQ